MGDSVAVRALVAGKAQPLSSASVDIDEDGVSDLLVGYGTTGGGVVVFHRGNLDAFAPQSRESFLAIAQGNFPSPFLPDAQVIKVPVQPDFMVTGNFTGSGHPDVAMAARGGTAVYVFSGDGTGKFASPQVISLPGGITALAAGPFGQATGYSSLIAGISGEKNSFSLMAYRGTTHGPARLASYPLSAAAVAIALGDVDGDLRSDAAILSGGQVSILHSGSMQLETVSLPAPVVSMALGSFVHDRRLRLQMALLSSDGSIQIIAPSGFDPRAFTAAEAKAMRMASLRGEANPIIPRQSAASHEAWQTVESFAAVAPYSSGSLPVLLRTRISSHATDDVMVFTPATSQMAVISHANVRAGATTFIPGEVSVRPYAGSPLTAVSARVNIDGRPGVILLHSSQVSPMVMMPLPDPTFVVNTTADTITANGCAAGNPNTCSLREAVIEANASPGADTIMVPAGTYQLTITPAAGADPHDATSGDLDINDGVSIVGENAATTIVEAGATAGSGIDKIFSINPLGLNAGFDTSISNLTLRFGMNTFAAGTGDEFGGALDWNAGFDGAGNLTITQCIITDNSTTDGDGGGLSLSNPGGTGLVTITNSTIQNNAANTSTTGTAGIGGGILAGSFTPLDITSSQVLNNQSSQALGAGGQGGGMNLGAFSHTAIHASTISGNQAAGDGGGIWTGRGLTIDQGTIISGNTAGGNGGGLWNDFSEDITQISKTTITGNTATGNGGGVHVDASAPQVVNINFSRIVNNTAAAGSGLDNIGAQIDATDNWWGCSQGPAAAPCDTVNDPNLQVTSDPWIVLIHTPNPATIPSGGHATLTASFLHDNHGTAIAVGNLSVLIGLPIQFNNPILGTISNQQASIQASGTATATYTPNAAGAGSADAVVDNATVTANTINLPVPSDLTITKSHTGNFSPGQTGAVYTLTVSNVGAGATVGTVTVSDALPAGLTATAISGTGWVCTLGSVSCTRADVLAAGGSYPAITLTVNVSTNIAPNVINTATVSGGGENNTANDTASDPTHASLVPLQLLAQGSSLSVNAGSVTSMDFTVESSPGIGLITFSCSGLPAGASCSFNPASESQLSATVTMTVTAAARSGAAAVPDRFPQFPGYPAICSLLGLAGLALSMAKMKKGRLRLAMLVTGLMVLLIFAVAGCGSHDTRGTPAGSFPITVTASGSTAQASTTVNLNVM